MSILVYHIIHKVEKVNKKIRFIIAILEISKVVPTPGQRDTLAQLQLNSEKRAATTKWQQPQTNSYAKNHSD